MAENLAVHGLERCDEKGPYGDDEPYCEHLRVEVDGEIVKVPITDVRKAAYDYHGGENIPDVVTFSRVTVDGDELHAEAWLKDGSLVELVKMGVGDSWTMHHFEDPTEPGLEEVWTLPDKEESEITMLVEQDLSAAEALDFWMVEMRGLSATEVGKRRGVSHQAVSENVRKARDKLSDGPECIHCGAVDEPGHDIHIRVEKNEQGEHYTVCNVCEPLEN